MYYEARTRTRTRTSRKPGLNKISEPTLALTFEKNRTCYYKTRLVVQTCIMDTQKTKQRQKLCKILGGGGGGGKCECERHDPYRGVWGHTPPENFQNSEP